LLNEKTCFVSLTYVSNALGIIVPIEKYINAIKEYRKKINRNIPILIDVAQAIQHIPIDVVSLDIDFIVASGHKMYAPTGIGFLYAKKELLESMIPYQTGGDMILSVSFEETIYNEIPYKFEAGTPNICGTIAFGKAIEYINSIGLKNIYEYEKELLDYATNALCKIDGLKIIGNTKNKTSVISFVLDDIHPHDIGTFLDADGIAVRTGHHCAEPTIKHFGIPATTRISFAFYNTKEEIDKLVESLYKIIKMFR
jgi:cysteine desulfurase/selenocysteine lyase